MIKVLIVEDSTVERHYLHYLLTADPEIEVVAMAKNGQEAVAMVPRYKPHVVIMDVNMPKMDGLEATRRIMASHPVPIVIVSTFMSPRIAEHTFQAIQAGALAIAEKPFGLEHPQQAESVHQLLRTIKLMSEVKVVTRTSRRPLTSAAGNGLPTVEVNSRVKLIAIGASTGGPAVLEEIFSGLPANFSIPIVVVQHITIGFLESMVAWLRPQTPLQLCIAKNNQSLLPGWIYFAPDNYHTGIGSNHCIKLSQDPPENNLRPAVSYLFRSVLAAHRARAIGILLTGMGSDGAPELKQLKDQGAITIAQDEATSIVYGMPGKAVSLGGATYILSPNQITGFLENLNKKQIQQESMYGVDGNNGP